MFEGAEVGQKSRRRTAGPGMRACVCSTVWALWGEVNQGIGWKGCVAGQGLPFECEKPPGLSCV